MAAIFSKYLNRHSSGFTDNVMVGSRVGFSATKAQIKWHKTTQNGDNGLDKRTDADNKCNRPIVFIFV